MHETNFNVTIGRRYMVLVLKWYPVTSLSEQTIESTRTARLLQAQPCACMPLGSDVRLHASRKRCALKAIKDATAPQYLTGLFVLTCSIWESSAIFQTIRIHVDNYRPGIFRWFQSPEAMQL